MTLLDGSRYAGLNVGSGPHYSDGWCNTDVLPAPDGHKDPDVLADIFDYGNVFLPSSFEKAYVGHVLEHIPFDKTVDAVQCIAGTVKPGGEVMVVGPCIERAIATEQPQELLDAIRFHPDKPQHPWSHAWTPTEALTLGIMQQSGLVDVAVLAIDLVRKPRYPNPSNAGWQTAVRGYVP